MARRFVAPLHIDNVGKEMDRKRYEAPGRYEVMYVPDTSWGFRVTATFLRHEVTYMLQDKCFQDGTILLDHMTGAYKTVRNWRTKRTRRVTKQVTSQTTSHELAKAGIL